jgi:hypothetical protein
MEIWKFCCGASNVWRIPAGPAVTIEELDSSQQVTEQKQSVILSDSISPLGVREVEVVMRSEELTATTEILSAAVVKDGVEVITGIVPFEVVERSDSQEVEATATLTKPLAVGISDDQVFFEELPRHLDVLSENNSEDDETWFCSDEQPVSSGAGSLASSVSDGYETADDVASDEGYVSCNETSDDEAAVAVLGDKSEHVLCAEGLLEAINLRSLSYYEFFIYFNESGEFRIAKIGKGELPIELYNFDSGLFECKPECTLGGVTESFYSSDKLLGKPMLLCNPTKLLDVIAECSEEHIGDYLVSLAAVLPESVLRYIVSLPDFVHNNTPAMFAMKRGFFGLVQRLVDLGADLSIPDVRGMKPIHWAAIHRNAEMVRLCLEHGDGVVKVRTKCYSSFERMKECLKINYKPTGLEIDAIELYNGRVAVEDLDFPHGNNQGVDHGVQYQGTERPELSDLRWHIVGMFSRDQLVGYMQSERDAQAEMLCTCEDDERYGIERELRDIDTQLERAGDHHSMHETAELYCARRLFCKERNAIPIDDTIPWPEGG